MHPQLINHYNAIEEHTAFIFPTLKMGHDKKNMHGSLVITEHVWNPLCTNFSFPQAVGDDTAHLLEIY
jgi:hypothetical protein